MTDSYDVVFFDLDGTFHLGGRPFDRLPAMISKLAGDGATKFVAVTNNTSVTPDVHVDKLVKMGLDRDAFELCSPLHVVAAQAGSGLPTRIFPLCSESVAQFLAAAGFDMATTNPLAVLVAFDIELTFDKLARASELLHAGAALFATHVDVRCPTSFGYVPDCGSMTKMLEQTTGVRCSGDFGKPSLAMADYLRSRFCANGERAIMIGDRIYTDIPLGHRIGIDTALVLTGEASGDDVAGSDFQPTIIVDSFESLLRDSFPHAW